MDLSKDDTRRYETHAEWCIYLSQRWQLAHAHKMCKTSLECKSPDRYQSYQRD